MKETKQMSYSDMINASKVFKKDTIEVNGMSAEIVELSGDALSDMNDEESSKKRLAIVLKEGMLAPKLMDMDDAEEMVKKNYTVANSLAIEILTLSGATEKK